MSVYIVAEAGVNHNGQVAQAFRLVDAAADAGANAVKFQTFRPEELVSPSTAKAAYQAAATGTGSQLEMLRALALAQDDFRALSKHASRRGIDFLSTPFDAQGLDFLVDELDMPIVKVASGEIVNGPLLLRAARKRRRLFVSTGMSTMAEVDRALTVVAHGLLQADGAPSGVPLLSAEGKAALKRHVVLLQCTSEYPAAPATINLRAMSTLSARFDLPCGLSDHSAGTTIPVAAAALGALVIEKHITLDRGMPGPDQAASLMPDEFADMVRRVHEVTLALGDGEKRPSTAELETAKVVRRVLVAAEPIAKGACFTETNLVSRRASGGRSPMDYWALIGRPASRAYRAGEAISE